MASTIDDRNPEMPGPPDESDYEHLIEDYSHFAPPSEGELLAGHVLKVTDKDVIVDFGYKSEGLVPKEQLTHPERHVPGSARRHEST